MSWGKFSFRSWLEAGAGFGIVGPTPFPLMLSRLKSLLALALPLTLVAPVGAADIPHYRDLFNGQDLAGWVNVNTAPDTWRVQDGLLICRGKPIGVMRTDRQYENFILHSEWMHLEPGGNSGTVIFGT